MAKMNIPVGDIIFSVNDLNELKDDVQKKYTELEAEINKLDAELAKLRESRSLLAKFLGAKRARPEAAVPKEGNVHAQG